MRILAFLLFAVLTCSIPMAFAHTTVSVDNYDIEVGWGVEPPIVNQRNDFVMYVTEPGEVDGVYTGVKNAFKEMSAVAIFGGERKTLDVNSESRPGNYFSPVIPTATGTYSVEFSGTLNGIVVQVVVPIEDVMYTTALDFPISGTESDGDTAALKSAISALQQQVRNMDLDKGAVGSADLSYGLATFGISFGIAGLVLGIISMIKRK